MLDKKINLRIKSCAVMFSGFMCSVSNWICWSHMFGPVPLKKNYRQIEATMNYDEHIEGSVRYLLGLLLLYMIIV